MVPQLIKNLWTRFWMRFAGLSPFGRIATHIATWFAPPYKSRCPLARLSVRGYIAPTAVINHDGVQFGKNIFLGDRVIIHKEKGGGPVKFGNGIHIHNDTIIETGAGGSLIIDDDTHIQPRCQFSAYLSVVKIGCGVEIAPNCAFYPYNHGFKPDESIARQPLETKGGITIDDNSWIGFGVIVLDGVHIGKGAVIGAGSVVTKSIPDGAIAAGVPARVIRMRTDSAKNIY